MILRLASAAGLMLVVAGPAFAIGPTCGKQNKDQEAQNLARQFREQMSEAGGTAGTANSGSRALSGTSR